MTETDISIVSIKIEEEKKYLSIISKEIWNKPELQYKEVHAHALLTNALEKYGFNVQKHYFIPTAFRAEFSGQSRDGPTIAVMCEYDALPEIGHACGHNLIAESGVAAGMAIKAAMEADPTIPGKVVVLGTPAEEGGGGKIRLIELGAFEGVDAALMVHPARVDFAFPQNLCIVKVNVTYKGKEAHASAYPWEGRNALDAAVACYVNISLLRQHIKPTCRIHGIITNGGVAPNIIPGESKMEFYVRAPTVGELKDLKKRVLVCFTSAAESTGCELIYHFDDHNSYNNVITNKTLGDLYKKHAESMGVKFNDDDPKSVGTAGSTDMGNVSHVVPSIHPFYSISSKVANHTKGFTEASGSPEAQEVTLIAAKAMALTAIEVMRSPKLLKEMKAHFLKDVFNESESSL